MLSDYVVAMNISADSPIFTLASVHIWRICRKYGAMIGVTNLHPHTFWHSFAIHLIRSSHVDIRWLQQLLSHSNIQTSTIYIKFRDSDLLEAYNRVEVVSLYPQTGAPFWRLIG